MEDPSKFVELTQRLLTHVEAQQETLKHLQAELNAHGAALCEMLAWLKQPDPRASEGLADAANGKADPAGKSDEGFERRTMPRRRGNPVSVLIANGQAGAAPEQGVVADRSPDGLCLILDHGVQIGAKLRIRPLQSLVAADWFPVEVRSCRKELKIWVVGCRFTHRLTWNNLRLFG
jgi:hypothetical protein